MKDQPEEDVFGKVERAVLRYLHEDEEGEADHNHSRCYDIILVDRFAASDTVGRVLFIAVVRERFPLPGKPEGAMLGTLLVTFQEDGSFKISAPVMSAHLASL
jgi:hypothetical protein